VKTDLSTFTNSEYYPGNFFKRALWYLIGRIVINTYLIQFQSLKRVTLIVFGAELGKGIIIKPKVNIKYPWNLTIGNNSWIGENVWIDNLGKVEIGSNVCISQGAMLLCGNHNYKKTTFDLMVGNIILEDGVWIGAKSVVCPGVTCKTHSILTVGSIATKNLEPYTINSGNPAVKIRERKIEE